jgi:hypothetical protein
MKSSNFNVLGWLMALIFASMWLMTLNAHEASEVCRQYGVNDSACQDYNRPNQDN